MTQALQTPRKRFVATASQTEFDYSDTFSSDDSTEIKVKQNNTLLTVITDYTVDIANGIITLVTAASENDVVAVYRITELSRTSKFNQNRAFRASVIDAELDRIVRILQELNDKADRCLRYDVTDDISSVSTELPEPVTGYGLIWDSEGQLTNGLPGE